MSLIGRTIEALREKGPKEGARFVWDRAKTYVVDRKREIVLLSVDLTNEKFHVRPRDQQEGFALLDLEPAIVPRLQEMLRRTAPARTDDVPARLAQGMKGMVAEVDGEVVGYVFYRPGTNDPTETVHPDLVWLPFRPKADEVYTFDYFIPEARRGLGNLFARAVQERQHTLGFVRSYGYVYDDNRPARWLYRTIGWKEMGKSSEQKILLKLALVDDRLFLIRRYHRAFLLKLPRGLT